MGGKGRLDTDMQMVVVVGDTVRSKMVMIIRLQFRNRRGGLTRE